MGFFLEAVGHMIRNRMQNPKERDQWWNEHIEKTETTRKRWYVVPLQPEYLHSLTCVCPDNVFTVGLRPSTSQPSPLAFGTRMPTMQSTGQILTLVLTASQVWTMSMHSCRGSTVGCHLRLPFPLCCMHYKPFLISCRESKDPG